MKARSIRRLAAPLAILSLAGCAGSISSYPSLAPRPVEQPAAESASPTRARALDGAVVQRIAALVAQARAGDDAFAKALAAGCPAIERGRGAATGGETWIAAQQALSAVEVERRATTQATGEIDSLVLDQARLAGDAATPMDLTPLTDAAALIGGLDDAQDKRLNALRGGRCRP